MAGSGNSTTAQADQSIYVAGHRGMVGSAIVRRLGAGDQEGILTRTRAQLDLTDQQAVDGFFADHRPQQVYLAAAKVGGIWANNTYTPSLSTGT